MWEYFFQKNKTKQNKTKQNKTKQNKTTTAQINKLKKWENQGKEGNRRQFLWDQNGRW